jgi:hypothetical protein
VTIPESVPLTIARPRRADEKVYSPVVLPNIELL